MVLAASWVADAFHQQGLENRLGLKELWMVQDKGQFFRENLFESARDLRLVMEGQLPAGQWP